MKPISSFIPHIPSMRAALRRRCPVCVGFTLVELLLPSLKLRRARIASFTLVELLIVIGILAILTAAVVVILNPAELLKQSRDGVRISDLNSIDAALSLLTTQNPDVSLGTASTVYTSLPDNSSSTCGSLALPALPSGYVYNCVTEANLRNVSGTGWIPVNFASSSIGSFISLPIDPINTAASGNYYTYMKGSWKLSALLESQKHANKAANDGGIRTGYYEKGSDVTLGKGNFASGIELATNGGAWKQTDWTDSNGDGFADGWQDTYAAQYGQTCTPYGYTFGSIVTGNGFTGNAQHVEVGCGPYPRFRITSPALTTGKKYAISLKYRSNVTVRIYIGSCQQVNSPLAINTSATPVLFSKVFVATCNNYLTLLYDTFPAGSWIEIDEVSLQEMQ